jgi:uncharacterized protein (TIGR02453 family)
MNIGKILLFLSDLEKNNTREWYHAHKVEYQEANAEFELLIAELIMNIGVTDSSILHNHPKELTFKIMRDTRFSKDKSPYNPSFRAHISSHGKLPVPVGYYISIRPDNRTFIGGGLFASVLKDATTMIRDYIVTHGADFQQIISDKSFKDNFVVMGEALKNIPKGYDKEHPQAQYLKNKSWYLEYYVSDALFTNSEQFVKEATEKYVLMQPFNTFLNKALDGFKMPTR